MARTPQVKRDAGQDFALPVERNRFEAVQGGASVGLGIERHGGGVLAETVTVGEVGILFLKIPAVGQQDLAELSGRLARVDRPRKALSYEQR